MAMWRFNVQLNGTDEVICQCGFFAHVGMLCRHALKVLLFYVANE
jgi:hypothetical protein